MTRKEAMRQSRQIEVLQALGFTQAEAESLRRISMTLRRWHELECGVDGGCIDRADDGNGSPYWMNSNNGKSYRIPDRENGAKKRLASIMQAHYFRPGAVQGLATFIQTDPRGAALYILRPGDVPAGQSADEYYTRGICVY